MNKNILVGSAIVLLTLSATYLGMTNKKENKYTKNKLIMAQDSEKLKDLHNQFREWEKDNGKRYHDHSEESYREIVFDVHELEIEESNKKHKEFHLKKNKFMDLTDVERRAMHDGLEDDSSFFQTKPNLSDHNLEKAVNNHKLRASNESVDYRKYDYGIKDQGRCGVCWAFANNAVLEQNFAKQPLSEQHLQDCVTDGRRDTGCQYGIARNGHPHTDFVRENGIAFLRDQPYLRSNNLSPKCEPQEAFKLPSDAEFVSFDDFSTPQCDKLKAMISEFGPTSISLYAEAPEFSFYDSGIASHDLDASWVKTESMCIFGYCLLRNYNVSHAVTLVGYTEEYWIVKNSWGKYWGEDGYIRIKMGNYFNICHKGYAVKSDNKRY